MLTIWVCNFLAKGIGTKAAHRMLVKLTPLNHLVVSRNLLPILLSKILLFFNLVKHTSKNFKNFEDYKSVLIFSLALVFVEFFLAIL